MAVDGPVAAVEFAEPVAAAAAVAGVIAEPLAEPAASAPRGSSESSHRF